ncbi:MAG TPA: peptidase M48 [Desulfobacteraceae bacterium]|nr:peptidase M48 [Desulfobacteraceae bacterium]|tara:strand:+ start:1057 stop:2322 length:1266 start_codon:yes stop_codon:yes gene_type:complete
MFISDQAITAIILVAVTGGYAANLLADFLNIGNLSPALPRSFADVYDADRYEKSQQYLKETTRLGVITATVDLVVLLIVWFSGGFGMLDDFVRGLHHGPVVSGLVFIGILAALKFVISLPFSVYATFGIEARFGFNKTSPGLFLLDTVKSIILGVALGALLLSVILCFFDVAGPLAWLYCWIATTLFLVAIQYIVPTWIMPLFNKFTPLEDGTLKEALFAYARSIDFPLAQIFVMDGSKRSAKANAFFTGFGKNRRIVLFDTLIQAHDTRELVAVLAHEMGHFKKKHIRNRLMLGIVQMGIIFYLLSLCISQESLFTAFSVTTPSVYAGLIFFSLLFSPVDMVISVALQKISRRDEYEADRFAADTTGAPSALISALKKLSAQNLSNLTPHPFYVFLNYSHPPVLERMTALNKIADQQESK